MYLIIKDIVNYIGGVESKILGYTSTLEKATEIVDILTYKLEKKNELAKYGGCWSNNSLKYSFAHIINYDGPIREYSTKDTKKGLDKKYDVHIKVAKERYNKEYIKKAKQQLLDDEKNRIIKESRILEIKDSVYEFINNDTFNNESISTLNTKLKDIREYLYLTSDPKVAEWIYKNNININYRYALSLC